MRREKALEWFLSRAALAKRRTISSNSSLARRLGIRELLGNLR